MIKRFKIAVTPVSQVGYNVHEVYMGTITRNPPSGVDMHIEYDTLVFKGTIIECEAFIRLAEGGYLA